jgi:hypothetical protein
MTVDFHLRIHYNDSMKHMFYFPCYVLTCSSVPFLLHFPWSPIFLPPFACPRSPVPGLWGLRACARSWGVMVGGGLLTSLNLTNPRPPRSLSESLLLVSGLFFLELFHFITKSRLKNAEFPFISASDYVICPKKAKINPARNYFHNPFLSIISFSNFVIMLFSDKPLYIIQSGNSAMSETFLSDSQWNLIASLISKHASPTIRVKRPRVPDGMIYVLFCKTLWGNYPFTKSNRESS